MFPTMLRAPAFPTPAWVSIVASRFLLLLGSCMLLRQLPYLSQRQLPYLQSGNDTKLNLKVIPEKEVRCVPQAICTQGLEHRKAFMPLLEALHLQDLPGRHGLPPCLAQHLCTALLPPAHLHSRPPLERTEPVHTSRPFLLVSLLLWHLFILFIRLSIMDKLPHNTAVHLSEERTFILLHSQEATIKTRHLTLRPYCHRIPDPSYFQLVNCLRNALCKSGTRAMIVCYP